MPRTRFDPAFRDLPATLPVFPLPGVLLLPGGRLPLNVFEPRYLNMVADALKGSRLIGMVQPAEPVADPSHPALQRVGCAGRIVSFSETDDGRYLIVLTGVCRFEIAAELPLESGYRPVRADWSRFRHDLGEEDESAIDRPRFLAAVERYLKAKEVKADWEAIREADLAALVTSLAMNCPFGAMEKQALLEAPDLAARAASMIAILEMAALSGDEDGKTTRQ